MSASSSRRRRALLAGAALCGVAWACGDTASHVYEGRLYREDRGCLATKSSVDVVEGERAGECAPTCLVQPLAGGGRAVYVATMCAPYPFMFDATGTHPSCAPALAAFARNDTCLADGDSSAPLPRDASAE